jgi:hypothetical protein
VKSARHEEGMFTKVEKLCRAGLMRDNCSDRVPTVGDSPRRRGRRRYNDDAPRAAVRRVSSLALHYEPICPKDEEKLNRSAKEQIDWSH